MSATFVLHVTHFDHAQVIHAQIHPDALNAFMRSAHPAGSRLCDGAALLDGPILVTVNPNVPEAV